MKSALLSFFAFLFSMQIFGQEFAPVGAIVPEMPRCMVCTLPVNPIVFGH
jgi:hypothetical protein